MEIINRLVVDLSHYEAGGDYNAVKAAGIVGIIYKATQGTGYHDKTYWAERERALAAGLIWGSYHFGDGSDVQSQIQNYLDYAKPAPEELFCLDFETTTETMSEPEAQQWVQGVEAQLNRPGECVLYSGNLIKEALGDKFSDFWAARRLWLAQYGPTPVIQKSWSAYWLWQYTDGTNGPQPHTVNGISGGIDCNSFMGTADNLKAQWASGTVVIPPVPPVPPEQPTVTIVIKASPGVNVEVVKQQQ